MTDEEKVLKRLKDTLDVLTGKNVITNLDFQIRNMVEDCIRVIEKQQAEIEKKDKIIDEMVEDLYGLADAINEEYRVEEYLLNKETIKEYYEKKVEEKQ